MATKELYEKIINDLIRRHYLDPKKFISRMQSAVQDHYFDVLPISSVNSKYNFKTKKLIIDDITRWKLLDNIAYEEVELYEPVAEELLPQLKTNIITLHLNCSRFEVTREYKNIYAPDGDFELIMSYPKLHLTCADGKLTLKAGSVNHLESLYLVDNLHDCETNVTIDTVTLGSNAIFNRLFWGNEDIKNLAKFLTDAKVKTLIIDGYFENVADKQNLDSIFPNIVYL